MAALAECVVHSAARKAVTGSLQDDFANTKLAPFEALKIDSLNDEIAANVLGGNNNATKKRTNNVEMLALHQGDSAFAAITRVSIADETA